MTPERPVLVFLHGLGLSAHSWRHVVHEMADDYDCVALDLPGHGDAAGSAKLTVEQMADAVSAELLARRPRRWGLVGHSMGGKIATIVTARFERGVPSVPPPLGLVLVASSPLSPEPMDDETRAQMIGWCAEDAVSDTDARTFIAANTAAELPEAELDDAVADVRRVARTAWLAWLERGSLEDWSSTVGPLRTPTLVVAGAEDGPLGADGQRRLVLPHVSASEVVEVPDAAHLVMLEQPRALAQLIKEAFPHTGPSPHPALDALIASDRVSARTRQALLERLAPPSAYEPVLTDEQRAVLVALVARVLPQEHTDVDLVARIEQSLALQEGDGSRFADLPDDQRAWRAGLDTLAAASDGFTGLDASAQDAVLDDLAAGRLGSDGPDQLSADQMRLWFEDVRAAAARTWISHPTAMARIGYDGFANGGDGVRKQGYLRVGAGELETWQILPMPTHDDRSPA